MFILMIIRPCLDACRHTVKEFKMSYHMYENDFMMVYPPNLFRSCDVLNVNGLKLQTTDFD